MKGNVINLNTLHLNSVRLNGIGKVQSVSLKGGSTEDPVFPPVEPPIEPEPTPTYTLSASVTNGKVSATRNGSAVNLPFTANEGDVIVVSVIPNDGYAFEGWADGNTDNPRSITMQSDVALSAQCVEVVQPPVGNYIQFEDKAVEAICVENWSSDGIGLTEEDAAAVTTIGTIFSDNTEITSFNELRYFTGLTFLSTKTSTNTGAFEGCSALESIVLPTSVTIIGDYSFSRCSALKAVGGMDNVVRVQRYAFHESAVEELILPSCTFFGDNIAALALTKKIVAPLLQKIDSSLNKAQYLELLEVGAGLTEITAFSFWAMTSNKTVFICRATTPPSMGSNNNMTFCSAIYVPDASLEAYRTATNWNQFADRIHPLSEIEDYYVSDALLMHLDGINKGNVEGEWQDLVSGNTFVNHGAIAEADGWGFDGASSYMDSATLGTIGWWNKARTLEVVVKFDDISENRTEVVFLGRKNCMSFGRYKSEHFFNSAGLSVPFIKIQSDNGKVIYGYCGNRASYIRSIINGQQGATSYGNSISGFLETTAYLGKKISNDDYFKGKIHAIRIHDRILSEEEILYNQRIDNKRFNLGLDI